MMFADDNDKSFLTKDELNAIEAFWGYMALGALEVSDAFLSGVAPNLPQEADKNYDLRTSCARMLIFSAIHRVAQMMANGDKYFAVMLESLESLCFTLCYDFVRDRLPKEIFIDDVCNVLSMCFVTDYLGVNTDYIRKAPSMMDCGYFQRMKISWAMQSGAKGLTLNIGDYGIGYALMGAWFINKDLAKRIDVGSDKDRMEIYKKLEAAFQYYFDTRIGNELKECGKISEVVKQETVCKGPDPEARLRRLKGLLDAGLITQDDYDAKKSSIIAEL